ncbi:putative glycosyl transferase [Halobacteriovorax marinus SJ]|uniref:Glycosyl transferase n=1 Tax=Halobacteriovorax marinus (strain ATCC BAA-682 / DSM 15412 / SJ) TaxID=862908 RepID=E1X3U9_HALMS|nr:glycosyltransferase family 4 protein [Halobacteriovorax marinus]CBW25289.1 putative glycosyl transferase [Halobacteriovorax marinus SJ]
MKSNLHYHSDCPFFGGCENMIANFLNSDQIHDQFSVSFTYRKSARYEAGLRQRVEKNILKKGLILFCWPSYLGWINSKFPSIISLIIKGVSLLLQFKTIFFLIDIFILYFTFRKRNIDILHINNGGFPAATSANSAVIAAKMLGIEKIFYVVNNIASPYSKIDRIFDWPIDYLVKKSTTKFITGSRYAGKELVKVLELQTEQYSTINNGISHRPLSESREEVLERLGIPTTRVIVGIVANLEKRKGHKYLLLAFAEIIKKVENAFLIIEGDGEELNNIQKDIENLNLKNFTLLIKREERIFNLINAFDVLVLPSIYNEDFPNIIIEAMSLEKPVVATRIAGIPEQIDQDKTGLIVKPKDVEELTSSLSSLIYDREMREKMGQFGKVKFEQKYEVNVSISNYIDLYTNQNLELI